jgi:hypothetical protein
MEDCSAGAEVSRGSESNLLSQSTVSHIRKALGATRKVYPGYGAVCETELAGGREVAEDRVGMVVHTKLCKTLQCEVGSLPTMDMCWDVGLQQPGKESPRGLSDATGLRIVVLEGCICGSRFRRWIRAWYKPIKVDASSSSAKRRTA